MHSLHLIDCLCASTGFGGQPFLAGQMEKVTAARDQRTIRQLNYRIQVDGGINHTTGQQSRTAGADTLVAGSSIFGAPDMAAAIRTLRAVDTP